MTVRVGERYQHYKGGKYTVIAIGFLESDPSSVYVVYRSEYASSDMPAGTVWIRPLTEFEESVHVDGRTQKRFMKVRRTSARGK